MTSSKKFFLLIIGSTFLFSIIITLLYVLNFVSSDKIKSILVAYFITSSNAAIGIASIKSGMNKAEKVFLRRVLGGIVLRLFLTVILVVLALVFLELNRISFIFSILFFYIYYLIIEIIYLNFR